MLRFSRHRRLRVATTVYWFLLFYIVAALIWWFIALQDQNRQMSSARLRQLRPDDPEYLLKVNNTLVEENRKTARNIGEGSTFLLVILVGAIFVYRAVRRQFNLQQQQQNFMMAVTHELKTPIAVAKLNLETLRKYDLDVAQKEKFINSALQELNRLNNLASNILVTSQLEDSKRSLTRENTDLSELVESVARQAEKNSIDRKWEIHVEPNLFINADGLLIQMLFSNLIENASRYSSKGSSIQVELKKSHDAAELSVVDQGPGIPHQERKRIFEKFYRIGNEATRSSPGTGLGLYLCKKIADYHRAQITVSDNLPSGSIFTVRF